MKVNYYTSYLKTAKNCPHTYIPINTYTNPREKINQDPGKRRTKKKISQQIKYKLKWQLIEQHIDDGCVIKIYFILIYSIRGELKVLIFCSSSYS